MISSTSLSSKKGFTIVEMLVSVGIMLMLSTIVIFSQSSYSSGARLRNLANDLSLSLRQAQVYGISVKEFSPNSNDFSIGYGVEFDITARGDINSYVFFADRGERDGVYNGGWHCPISLDSECLDKTLLGADNFIQTLCVINSEGDETCGATRIDITFVRPATEANVIINGDPSGAENIRGVRIGLANVEGKTNSVVIYTTGQISVQ